MFGTVAGLAIGCYGTIYHQSASFYLLPSRLWEMGAGGLAVLTAEQSAKWTQRYSGWCSAGGALLVLLPALCYDERTAFPGFAAIPPVCGAMLLLLSGTSSLLPFLNRLLAAAPLQFLGKISYSLYLWHWPVLVIYSSVSATSVSATARFILLCLSVALAAASWRWIEQPFRGHRLLPERRLLFAAFASITVLMVGAATAVVLTSGAEFRLSPQLKAFQETTRREPKWCQEHTAEDVPSGLLRLGSIRHNPRILVWGDSHAMSILPAIDSLCLESDVCAMAATHSSTAPLMGYFVREQYGLNERSLDFSDAVIKYVETEKLERVLLVSTWWFLKEFPESEQALLNTARALRTAGAEVYLLKTVPVFTNNVAEQLVNRSFLKLSLDSIGMTEKRYEEECSVSSSLESKLVELGVHVLNPADALPRSSSGLIAPYDSSGAYYYDSQHLSPYGALAIRKVFLPFVTGR